MNVKKIISINKFFTHNELACPCCGKAEFVEGWIDLLTSLRIRFDNPMIITSGCRCWRHHFEIYRKKEEVPPLNSKHLMEIPQDEIEESYQEYISFFKEEERISLDDFKDKIKKLGCCAVDVRCTESHTRRILLQNVLNDGMRAGVASSFIHIDGGHLFQDMAHICWKY